MNENNVGGRFEAETKLNVCISFKGDLARVKESFPGDTHGPRDRKSVV